MFPEKSQSQKDKKKLTSKVTNVPYSATNVTDGPTEAVVHGIVRRGLHAALVFRRRERRHRPGARPGHHGVLAGQFQ